MVRKKVTITDPDQPKNSIPIPSIDLNMSGYNEEMQKMHITAINSESDEPPDDAAPKIWRKLMKNWRFISQPVTLLFIFLLLWGISYSIQPEYTKPNSPIMRILFLFVGAQICGIFVGLTGLPDMLGMLFWGVLYKNIGLGDFTGYESLEIFLRDLALINIMLLAGLGLDLDVLKKLSGMVARLTFIPTIFEVASITVLSHYLLNMPWLWGALLGLVVTAVSPNVVVTVLLNLKAERLGLYKGIHTIILAMTSCNDVIAIFLFGVVLSVIFSTGQLTDQLLQGPIGIGIGLVFGGINGFLLMYMPSNKSKYTISLRFTQMMLAGVLSVVGSRAIGFPSAGALGCITISFVAGTGWRKQTGKENSDVAVYLDLLWKFLKPVSFSLIGKEVDFKVLDGNTVLYGIIILLVGIVLRLVFAYTSSYGGDLNWKEKGYVTISSFPKATVQAALGPAALDLARKLNSEDNFNLANTVLVISVLAIILTAPLGAILMTKLGPVWLKRIPATQTL